MRITLGAIKEILTEYNKSKNRNLVITNEMLHQIKDYFEEVETYKGTPEELVIDTYEDFLLECEHEDYDICDDEDDVYNGQGDLIRTNKYQYAICRICGANAPVRTVESEDSYDREFGDWERI